MSNVAFHIDITRSGSIPENIDGALSQLRQQIDAVNKDGRYDSLISYLEDCPSAEKLYENAEANRWLDNAEGW